MSISSLAMTAKKVIDAAWEHGPSYDLASQAAFALESAQLLQSPETAAEHAELRTTLEKRTTLLLEVQAMCRRRGKEIDGRKVYEARLKADIATLTATVRAQDRQIAAVHEVIDKRTPYSPRMQDAMVRVLRWALTNRDDWRRRAETAEAEVRALQTERHSTNEALSDAAEQMRANRDQVAELEARLAEYERPADEDPITFALTPEAERAVDRLTRMLAPTQVLQAEGPTGGVS